MLDKKTSGNTSHGNLAAAAADSNTAPLNQMYNLNRIRKRRRKT